MVGLGLLICVLLTAQGCHRGMSVIFLYLYLNFFTCVSVEEFVWACNITYISLQDCCKPGGNRVLAKCNFDFISIHGSTDNDAIFSNGGLYLS